MDLGPDSALAFVVGQSVQLSVSQSVSCQSVSQLIMLYKVILKKKAVCGTVSYFQGGVTFSSAVD